MSRVEPYIETDPNFRPPVPKPIVIIGAPASGKSTIGKLLSNIIPNSHWCDLDKCYAENNGITMTELYASIPTPEFYQQQTYDLETCLSGTRNFIEIVTPGGGIHHNMLNLQRIFMYSISFYLKADLATLQRNFSSDSRRTGEYYVDQPGLTSIDNINRFVNHIIDVNIADTPETLAQTIKDLYDCYPPQITNI